MKVATLIIFVKIIYLQKERYYDYRNEIFDWLKCLLTSIINDMDI